MDTKTYPYCDPDANLGIRAADDWLLTLTFDDPATDEPLNLTDCSAILQVRDTAGALILQADTAAGTLILGGAAGTLNINVPKADTDLTPGLYTYGLKITDADSRDLTWLSRAFEIVKKVVY